MSGLRENATFDTIDFSHLDEETETDGAADGSVPVGHHNVDLDIMQPHLSLPPPPPTAARRNPRERGIVVVDEGITGERQVHQKSPSDEDEKPDGDTKSNILKENGPTANGNSNRVTGINQNGHSIPDSENVSTSTTTGAGVNSESSNGSNGQTVTKSNPVQICFSKNTGNISVREGQVNTREDGSRYISTQQIPEQWGENERKPLRTKRIRWIKFFSIISCILFFPTGIPAVYFAFKIEKEFEEGIMRGNIDRAQKFATRSERLCILSVILCILIAALIVTLIERPHFQTEHYHRGTVTG